MSAPPLLFLVSVALVSCLVWNMRVTDESRAEANPPASKSLPRIERNLALFTPLNASRVPLNVGTAIQAQLGAAGSESPKDGTPIDIYEFRGDKGTIIEITLQAEGFTPLFWVAELKRRLLLGGAVAMEGDTALRMTTVLPRTGSYVVAVNSHGESGDYEVRLGRKQPIELPLSSKTTTRRALLIGVDDYVGTNSDLLAPAHDANSVKEFLIREAGYSEEDIALLEGPYATRKNVVTAIRSFLGSVPQKGIAILYFSGHGVQLVSTDDTEQDRLEEALYLADGSYLIDNELRALVSCLGAMVTVVFVDACYSGGLYRGAGAKQVAEEQVRPYLDLANIDERLDDVCTTNGLQNRKDVDLVISASQENQLAWEWRDWDDSLEPGSVFTRYIIEETTQALKMNPKTPVTAVVKRASNRTSEFTSKEWGQLQEAGVEIFSAHQPQIRELFFLEME